MNTPGAFHKTETAKFHLAQKITWKHTRREEGEPNPFEDPVLKDIASETGKSIAQIILRFRLQNGICVIPKSITPGRLKENLDVFDFELSSDDMNRIADLNRDLRVYKEPIAIGHPEYPFDEPY